MTRKIKSNSHKEQTMPIKADEVKTDSVTPVQTTLDDVKTDQTAAIEPAKTEIKAETKPVTAAEKATVKKPAVKKSTTRTTAKASAKTSTKASEKKVTEKSTPKKTVAKKEAADEKKVEQVFVEYLDAQYNTEEIIAKVKDNWVKMGHKVSSIKSLRLYIKPEDYAAYYVINDKVEGKVLL